MKIVCFAATVLCLGFSGAVQAEATTRTAANAQKLFCKLSAEGAESVVPPEVLILYVSGSKKMKVSSSFLVASDLPIVDAKVSNDTSVRLTLKWKVKNLRGASKQEFDVRQTLSWQRNTGQATIRGVVAGYDVDMVGSGTCSFTK